MDDIRTKLDSLIHARGEDYASLSRLLGRNAAYIQQYIRRGVPRKLDEDDRKILADYLGVDEAELGAPDRSPPSEPRGRSTSDGIALVPRLAVGASAGPGALDADETPMGQIGFDSRWLRQLTANPKSLSIIQVSGDSMTPTLTDGDDILVDRADAADRVRDGIYVLRVDDTLIVKRLAINPVQRSLTVRSDNPAYPEWANVDPSGVDIVGRVIWTGRRIR